MGAANDVRGWERDGQPPALNTGHQQEVWRSLKSPPSHPHIRSLSLMPFSCRHMGKGGWRVEDGTEHICHLFASPKNEQHVKECPPLVLLTSLSISQETDTEREKLKAKQRRKWVREKGCEIDAEQYREKNKSLVGISGNEEVWKLIPVERSRRAL